MEALAWYLHLDRRGEGHDLRDAYRDLAWEVAREGAGPRVVDDFEYYERLIYWTRSGAWDADPVGAGLQPESDPSTYNGAIWQRATELYFGPDPGSVDPGDPAWEQALDYYRSRAYPPELLWDWRGAENDRVRFAGLVDESDENLREATVMLGMIVANHLLSATDAWISARLREETGGRVDAELSLRNGGMRRGIAFRGRGAAERLRPGVSLGLRVEVRP